MPAWYTYDKPEDMKQPILHVIRQCTNTRSSARFPTLADSGPDMVCPFCKAATIPVGGPYQEYAVEKPRIIPEGPYIEALLDNIRSIYNVGAMFRTSDGVGIRKLHLCGMTPTPDNPRLAKTALGSQETVSWSYHRNGLSVAQRLKDKGIRLWALEGGTQSEPLSCNMPCLTETPAILVIGNEISGVDPGILELCDRVFHIPMYGIKTSLNASVAFGIAVYALRLFSQKA